MGRLLKVPIYVMGRLLMVPIYVMGRLLMVPIYVMGRILKVPIYVMGRILKVPIYVIGRILMVPQEYREYLIDSSEVGALYYLNLHRKLFIGDNYVKNSSFYAICHWL